MKKITSYVAILTFFITAGAASSKDLSSLFRGNDRLTLAVQAQLNELGFNVGSEDGLWGDRTARALSAFASQYTAPNEKPTAEELLGILQSVRNSWHGNPFESGQDYVQPPASLSSKKIFTSDIRGTTSKCESCSHVVTHVLGAGDFNNDEMDELVVGQHVLDVNGTPVEQATKLYLLDIAASSSSVSDLKFANGPHELSGIHEREAVIADFNRDGVDDLFIADHGLDTQPFPGAQNMLVLSSPDGPVDVSSTHLPQISDMSHGADSGDVDGDGDIDIVVATHPSSNRVEPYVLLNDGTGSFEKRDLASLIKSPNIVRLYDGDDVVNSYSTFRLIDINGDNYQDLLLLRSDPPDTGPLNTFAHILLNDGTGVFDGANPLNLPTNRWGYNTFTNDADSFDLDDNGLVDLILTQSTRDGSWRGHYLQVFLQEEPNVFVDRTANRMWNQGYNRNLDDIHFATRTELMDLDGDGDMDIVTRSLSASTLEKEGFESAIAQVGINSAGVFYPIDPRWLSKGPDSFIAPVPGRFGRDRKMGLISHQLHASFNDMSDEIWGADFFLHDIPDNPVFSLNSNDAASKLKLSWSIEMSDEGYERNLHAEDLIFLNENSEITRITHTNVSRDGVSGREELEYLIDDETFQVLGIVEVLDGERLFINLSAKMEAKQVMRTFGAQDKLILTWETLN